MSNALKRRLAKIEQAAQPVKLMCVRLLAAPADSASPEALAKRHADLGQVEWEGGMAIVLVGIKPKHGHLVDCGAGA